MFENYQDLVLATYKRKRDNGELSMNLTNPTTAKLKKACVRIYNERYDPKDDDILSIFFDVDKTQSDFRQIIAKTDDGDFRPLLNHVKDVTEKTDDKNSELLAWLIDFKPRPSTTFYKSLREKAKQSQETIVEEGKISEIIKGDNQANENNNKKVIGVGENQTDSSQKPPPIVVVVGQDDAAAQEVGGSTVKDIQASAEEETIESASGDTNAPISKPESTEVKSSMSIKWILVGSILVLLIGGAASLLWENILDRPTPTPDNCMYWTGEYYKGIACDKNNLSTPVVPMDRNKLMHLTKITIPDTLTKNSLGKVWYSKINGSHEFFTDSGMHPVDTVKRLRPVTPYILYKYTSYYRYILTKLVWGISIISAIILLVVLIAKELKKTKWKGKSSLISS